ncbi:hypothetical protein BD413DRAFT_263094 [Trametes elegans]|nr:hypothetical protein BD413DRAFT_263094 [Trametes elegans]
MGCRVGGLASCARQRTGRSGKEHYRIWQALLRRHPNWGKPCAPEPPEIGHRSRELRAPAPVQALQRRVNAAGHRFEASSCAAPCEGNVAARHSTLPLRHAQLCNHGPSRGDSPVDDRGVGRTGLAVLVLDSITLSLPPLPLGPRKKTAHRGEV